MTLDPEPKSARSHPSSQSGGTASTGRRERRWARDIRASERFAKVTELLATAQTVWVVWHTVELPGLPKHVKLIQESDPNRVVTVALSALADRRLYRRLDSSPPPVDAGRLEVADGAGGRVAARDTLVPCLSGGREPGIDPEAERNAAERGRP
ncbi:MAG: hypothetical protein JNM75_14310 [Rhodospirillales bacterium]|nr:hypothetical protein [Rhodospirillales bacterium]